MHSLFTLVRLDNLCFSIIRGFKQQILCNYLFPLDFELLRLFLHLRIHCGNHLKGRLYHMFYKIILKRHLPSSIWSCFQLFAMIIAGTAESFARSYSYI